jgi:sorbitol-specific phosphotransferase system component IIC
MVVLPMAVPFIVLVLAAIVAMLGLRKSSVWVWFVATAVMVYVFQGHITDPLKIAL